MKNRAFFEREKRKILQRAQCEHGPTRWDGVGFNSGALLSPRCHKHYWVPVKSVYKELLWIQRVSPFLWWFERSSDAGTFKRGLNNDRQHQVRNPPSLQLNGHEERRWERRLQRNGKQAKKIISSTRIRTSTQLSWAHGTLALALVPRLRYNPAIHSFVQALWDVYGCDFARLIKINWLIDPPGCDKYSSLDLIRLSS